MQLNKVLKGILIAIPMVALAACSTSSQTNAGGEGNINDNNADQTQASGVDTSTDALDVSSVERPKTFEEKQMEKDAELRQTQVVYFEYDKNNVQFKYNEMLSAHARFLVKNPSVKLTIEGHCDERGTPEYNIALGERRAKSVAKYLTTLGVQQSQISIVSYGEEKPADKSRSESGFAQNRRAVLLY